MFFSVGSKTRHSTVSPEELSRKWRVGVNAARQTLKATMQRGIRTAMHPSTRCYRTDHFSLRCCRLNTQFCSDTVFATTKSLKGNKCAQVFTAKDFIRVHPMVSKQECSQALQIFAEDISIPADPCTDGAAELTGPNQTWSGESHAKSSESGQEKVNLTPRPKIRPRPPHKSSRRGGNTKWQRKESMGESGILGTCINWRSCRASPAGKTEGQEQRESQERRQTFQSGQISTSVTSSGFETIQTPRKTKDWQDGSELRIELVATSAVGS